MNVFITDNYRYKVRYAYARGLRLPHLFRPIPCKLSHFLLLANCTTPNRW